MRPREVRVEGGPEGEQPGHEEHRACDDRDLVDEQHHAIAVDADDQHARRKDPVGEREQLFRFLYLEQRMGGADHRIAARPHADREERDRGQQAQERPHDAPDHPEVGARGDRIVGAVHGTENSHRPQDQRADAHPGRVGRHRLPERQTQHDGKGAEHRRGERITSPPANP